jgi:hypothetical protein
MKPYMTTKAPVFGNLCFGMTKDTALGSTSLKFNHEDTNTGDIYFKLPLVAEGQKDGFAVCSFDDLNKIENARLFFYPDGLTEQGYETLQENILNSFTRWLGEADDHSSSYYDVYRRWSLRSAQITYSVSENYIVVSFNAVD